jgi:Ca2+-binding RTX toxin-like protein
VYDTYNGNYYGAGNDTYLFGVGDGQDTIYDNDSTAGNTDRIVFKPGVLPANVQVVRVGDSLVLRINGTTDQITVTNYFNGGAAGTWQVEQIRFNDGTSWDYNTVQGMLASNIVNGTAGADTLLGTALDDQLFGLDGNDTLTGAAGNDLLDGGMGNDTMSGGAGNDVYVVNATTDVITELLNEGVDTVRSAVTWTLGSNLENLFLTGTGAINGTGNSLDNRLIGNSAANTLNGGAGADFMEGGLGNDTYQVDNVADVVRELASEGTDTVKSSLSWTLGANLENLTLLGTTAINGTGNELNNTITGNAGANILSGGSGNDTLNAGAGDDTLIGGLGNDNLTGGAGADTYQFGRGEGVDTLVENDATVGVSDRLLFGANVAANQLWFVRNGNNLEVSIVGSNDRVVLSNWYLGSAYHVERFQLAGGQSLTDTNVQNLVQAMAAFAPPAQGSTNWSAAYETSLQPVLAANWV